MTPRPNPGVGPRAQQRATRPRAPGIGVEGRFAAAAAALVLCAGAAYGQPPAAGPAEGNLDVTMTLLPQNATGPEDVTRVIELPAGVRERKAHADAAAAGGHPDAAGQAASPARGPGGGDRVPQGKAAAPRGAQPPSAAALDAAEGARELGSDVGRALTDQAQENREARGRGRGAGTGGGPGQVPGGPPGGAGGPARGGGGPPSSGPGSGGPPADRGPPKVPPGQSGGHGPH